MNDIPKITIPNVWFLDKYTTVTVLLIIFAFDIL